MKIVFENIKITLHNHVTGRTYTVKSLCNFQNNVEIYAADYVLR